MTAFGAAFALLGLVVALVAVSADDQAPLKADKAKYRAACPDYKHYATRPQWVHSRRLSVDQAEDAAPPTARGRWSCPSSGRRRCVARSSRAAWTASSTT